MKTLESPAPATSADFQSTSALARLRRETSTAHADVDALVRRPFGSIAAYVQFLSLMRIPHAGIEEALGNHSPALAELGYEHPPRKKWIDADLAALGVTPVPGSSDIPMLDDTAVALGAVYVIEGSALGGRVLLREALAVPDIADRGATRFLEGHRDATGHHWQMTVALLERFAERHGPAALGGMVQGATRAFALFHRVLDREAGSHGNASRAPAARR